MPERTNTTDRTMTSIIFTAPNRYIKRRKPRRRTAYVKRDETLAKMGFESYANYLASPLWQAIRSAKIAVDPNCEICNEKAEHVHHLSYKFSVLRGQKRYWLVSVCQKCHRKIEFTKGGKKRTFSAALTRAKWMLIEVGAWKFHTAKGNKRGIKRVRDMK